MRRKQILRAAALHPQVGAAGMLAMFFALSLLTFGGATPAAGQVAQLPERPSQHLHAKDMNFPSGVTDKCAPRYTYDEGPRGPSQWEGVCKTGQMQSPIDI